MTIQANIIGAFSEEQVARLTGLSRGQLRAWNRRGFIRPEFKAGEGDSKAFTYIYSFKDLLKLRVLNQLRNVYNVPMKELERVERELAHMGEGKWTSQKLWVFNRRVVFQEPETHRKREIASKQYVAEILLEVIAADARLDIQKLNRREGDAVGRTERRKQVHASELVFVGTRIPVQAVADFLKAGYSDSAIIDQFPDLEVGDIDAARDWLKDAA